MRKRVENWKEKQMHGSLLEICLKAQTKKSPSFG